LARCWFRFFEGIGRVLVNIGGHWKAAGGVGWRALVGHWFRFFEGIGRALVGIGGYWKAADKVVEAPECWKNRDFELWGNL
jgi:hypothetical protein